MPRVTVNYLECIGDLGFSYSSEIGGGLTLSRVADYTLNLAYKKSKTEDTVVALRIVHNCLGLAQRNATSSTDRISAHSYAQKATRDITVIKTGSPAIELDPPGTLDCGSADIGTQVTCNVTIKSTGVAALRIDVAQVTGANSNDFTSGDECDGMTLVPDQSCTMTVRFDPSSPGLRTAALIIHQNLPPPDQGTSLQLTGTGTGTPPPEAEHTLTVTVDTSAAAGQVTAEPGGTVCSAGCAPTFADGTAVTLTATPDQSGVQVTWGGCDSINSNSCTVNMNADRAVTASFLPTPG